MRQIFFTSTILDPKQLMLTASKAFTPAIPGAHFHIWTDGTTQACGVVEMDGDCDAERVLTALESQGFTWLPNHLTTPTTMTTMTNMYTASGFPPLKPKRF